MPGEPPGLPSGAEREALARKAAAIIQDRAGPLLRAHGLPGLSACVTSVGGPFHAMAFGVRELGRPEPVETGTIFQIGSVSKSISSIAAARMPLLGLLGLDEPVVGYLRSWKFPERMTRAHDVRLVTLRGLLSHTAGFNVHGYPYVDAGQPLPTAAQILEGCQGPDTILDWKGPPCETMHYSSAHFVLFQLLVEDITGRPFAEWMDRNLLLPLGMLDSAYLWDDSMRTRFAMRHTGEGHVLPQKQRAVLASSNLHTTASDLARALVFPMRSRFGDASMEWFLPASASAELARPQPVDQVAAGEERHWGLGWYLGRPEVQTTYKAGGAFEGVWCWLEAFPASGVCVVLLTNSQSGARATHPIMSELRPFLLHPDQPHANA